MVARRTLAFIAALITAAFVAGCAQTVTGTASFAEGAGAGPTGSGSSPSSDSSSSSPDDSGSSSSSSSSDSSDGGDKGDVCAALDKGETERAMGGTVTLRPSQSSGCQVSSSNGKSLIVAVFDFLTLSEYKKGSFTNLNVGGHPAIKTDSNIIYVARSTDPDDEGLLAGYFSGLEDGGAVASNLLAQLLKKYSR
jgi:hypothetical protein